MRPPSVQPTAAALNYPPPRSPVRQSGKILGTIVDKEGAFKSVILRDNVSATENFNAHYRLYLRGNDACSRTKMKCVSLASNPTPSATICQKAATIFHYPVTMRLTVFHFRDDPKLSATTGGWICEGSLDSQISSHTPNLKAQWPLTPVRSYNETSWMKAHQTNGILTIS